MELAFSLVALVVALAGFAFAWSVRSQLAVLPRADAGAADIERLKADMERLQHDVSDLRGDLEHSQRELEELKAVTQVAPAPPLPRARAVGLPDLREQLRAAHREPDPESDD